MEVAQELHRYRYELEDALSLSGTVTYPELPGLIEQGKLILYRHDRAVVLCEPIKMTIGWIMCIFAAAGDMDACLEVLDQIEAEARAKEASAVTIVGRPGWIRVTRKRGYRTDAVTLVKEL
jgi:hypothetical protein